MEEIRVRLLGKAGKNRGEMRTNSADWTAHPMGEADLRKRTHGFIAIYERRCASARLYLRQRGALRDEWGRVFPDAALNWAEYGRGWRAYAVAWAAKD